MKMKVVGKKYEGISGYFSIKEFEIKYIIVYFENNMRKSTN